MLYRLITVYLLLKVKCDKMWFQTNQPEHESDDLAGDTVTSVSVTNQKDVALQLQI